MDCIWEEGLTACVHANQLVTRPSRCTLKLCDELTIPLRKNGSLTTLGVPTLPLPGNLPLKSPHRAADPCDVNY